MEAEPAVYRGFPSLNGRRLGSVRGKHTVRASIFRSHIYRLNPSRSIFFNSPTRETPRIRAAWL